MVLYSAVKLLQDGILNNDPKAIELLKANKYFFLPVVNVDGLAAIEQDHNLYGKT